jgi:DNA-binding NtrC family response regulator
MDRTISMLIADDSRLVHDIVYEAARASHLRFRISATDNGRDCLTMLAAGRTDMAFIDVHMPELSGMEAFWAARKQGISTFVTLMSGSAPPEVCSVAQQLKAYEFLVKPFSVTDVVQIMRTYDRVTRPMKVLIVDDSSTTRQIVQRVLQASMFNCDITEAKDGTAALEACRRDDFDTVILDCNMPGLDGIATLKRLRAIKPTLKVVMVSSQRDPLREREAFEYGAHGFLPKPFYAEDMDRMLHAVHGLRRPMSHLRPADRAATSPDAARLSRAGLDAGLATTQLRKRSARA